MNSIPYPSFPADQIKWSSLHFAAYSFHFLVGQELLQSIYRTQDVCILEGMDAKASVTVIVASIRGEI